MRHADFLKKRKLYYSFRFWVFRFSFVCSTRRIVIARLATCTACIFRKHFLVHRPNSPVNAAAAGIWNNIIRKRRTSQPSLSPARLFFFFVYLPFRSISQRYFGRQCLHHTHTHLTIFYCSAVWMCVFCRCCCCFVFLGLIFSPLWYSCFISNRFQKLSNDVWGCRQFVNTLYAG